MSATSLRPIQKELIAELDASGGLTPEKIASIAAKANMGTAPGVPVASPQGTSLDKPVRDLAEMLAFDRALAERVTREGNDLRFNPGLLAQVEAYRPGARKAFTDLAAFVREHTGEALSSQLLAAVRDFVEAHVTFESDALGIPDRWQPLLTTMLRGAGDCDDYAIAYYAVLRAIGVPATKMTLLTVHMRFNDPSKGQGGHAVTAVWLPDGRQLILDNASDGVYEVEGVDIGSSFASNRATLTTLSLLHQNDMEFDEKSYPRDWPTPLEMWSTWSHASTTGSKLYLDMDVSMTPIAGSRR
mgnify:FL=1